MREWSVADRIASIESLEELEGFIATVRNPPPGVVTVAVEKEHWVMIAHRKIALKRSASA